MMATYFCFFPTNTGNNVPQILARNKSMSSRIPTLEVENTFYFKCNTTE